MTNPVPGYKVTTAYHLTGQYWTTCGYHTGSDYAAPTGTKVVAARPGTVKHVNYGSSFGSKQVAVQCDDGTEDFYAHMSSRVPNGTKVALGAKVGEVGNEGNSTGSHLHFERHKQHNTWSCSTMDDPMKSHNYEEELTMTDEQIEQLAKSIAKHVWKDDIVPTNSETNPTWMAGSYLLEIHEELVRIRKAVEAK